MLAVLCLFAILIQLGTPKVIINDATRREARDSTTDPTWDPFQTPTPSPVTTPSPTPAPPQSPTPKPTAHTFTFYNNCTEDIWVAGIGNPGFEHPNNGGWLMARYGPPVTLSIPIGWQGRFWARVACNFTASGDCDPPYQPCCASGSCLQENGKFGIHCAQSGIAPNSLIEVSLDNPSPVGPYDVYDISLVDGWSVPLSMKPVNGTYNTKPDPGNPAPWCEYTGCEASPRCPQHLTVPGTTLSCWSPCQHAVNAGDDKHLTERLCCVCTLADPNCDCTSSNNPWSPESGCCDNGFGCTPYHIPPYPIDTQCNPWSTQWGRGWPQQDLAYIDAIEGACKDVYTWQFDDKAATFQCRKTDGLVDYDIAFVTRWRDDEKP